MGLDAKHVKAWANGLHPQGAQYSWAEIARQGGVQPRTLTLQRSRNNIDAKVVINMAREQARDPLGELSTFPGYEGLAREYPKLTARELLTQVAPSNIFDEISFRLSEKTRVPPDIPDWGGVPRSLAAWFGLNGPNYGVAIRGALNISDVAASKKVNAPQFKVEEIVPVAQALELNPKAALLMLGYINEKEAGVAPLEREKALLFASADELADHLDHVLRHVRRRLQLVQQQADDEEIAMRLS